MSYFERGYVVVVAVVVDTVPWLPCVTVMAMAAAAAAREEVDL